MKLAKYNPNNTDEIEPLIGKSHCVAALNKPEFC